MIRLAIHAISALVLILWMASPACGGMIYWTNGPVEIPIPFGTSPVSREVPTVEWMDHEAAARDATGKLALSVEPFPKWHLDSDPVNFRNTLIDTAGFPVDTDRIRGVAGVDRIVNREPIHWSFMATGLEEISTALCPTTTVQQVGMFLPMPAPNVPAQEIPNMLLWPLAQQKDLSPKSNSAQEPAISAIKSEDAMAFAYNPSASLPWKDEVPHHRSTFPRDAMLNATGTELISRSLKESGNQHSSNASGDEAPPRLSSHLAKE